MSAHTTSVDMEVQAAAAVVRVEEEVAASDSVDVDSVEATAHVQPPPPQQPPQQPPPGSTPVSTADASAPAASPIGEADSHPSAVDVESESAACEEPAAKRAKTSAAPTPTHTGSETAAENKNGKESAGDKTDAEYAYDPPRLPGESRESYLHRLVPLVLSSDATQQADGTRGLRQLLVHAKQTADFEPAVQGVLDAGLLARLLQLCKEPTDDAMQLDAAWSIGLIASCQESQAIALVDADALPVLVAMTEAANDKVKEHAVRAIGSIASTSAQFDRRALEDAVPQLITLCMHEAARAAAADADTNLDLLRTISWTFEVLLNPRHWTGKMSPSIAPVLVRLLDCRDEEAMAHAGRAISSLAGGRISSQNLIIETGAVPRLVQLLSHVSEDVVSSALSALQELTQGPQWRHTIRDYRTRIQAVLDCDDAVSNLRTLLTHEVSSTRKDACLTISHIAAGSRDQIEAVLKADVISLLLDRMRDEDVMVEAARTITNVVKGGTDAQIRFLASAGVIRSLCGLLTATESRLVVDTLKNLDGILRVGAADARASGAPTNAYAREVEACGGLASLAALRFCEDRHIAYTQKLRPGSEKMILTHFDGYAIPDQRHPLKALPTPFDDRACRPPRTLRELNMLRVMGAIKEKPDWPTKVHSDITAKWTSEALAQCPSLTPASLEWCFEELRYQASKRVGPIQHAAIDGVWQADGLIDSELKASLLAGVNRLASVPADQLDWHPGTNQQVLDLVHPSMYCYRIGKSRVTEQRFGVAEAIDMIGQGTPNGDEDGNYSDNDEEEEEDEDAEEDAEEYEDEYEDDYMYGHHSNTSRRFQWLPAEFRVGDDGGVTVESYINNLHPVEDAALYPVIGDIFARFVPMFERVLADLRTETHELRIVPNVSEWYDKPHVPDDENAADEQAESKEDPEEEEEEVDWDNRPIYLPDVGHFHPVDYTASSRVTLAGRRLQVIVKVARIHLTPESPTYSGGSWHVEGMRNESIVASGIYYFASENVSESRLAFRQAVEEPPYEQSDDRGVRLVYGLENEGPLNQVLGSVITCADRCLAFPNIYQHQVQPFHLTDATRPGHRSILVFFLVDPSIQTVSSATVPPQQAHWARAAETPFHRALLDATPLIDPIVREVLAYADLGVITRRQSESHREVLMKERKFMIKKNTRGLFERAFSLCEH